MIPSEFQPLNLIITTLLEVEICGPLKVMAFRSTTLCPNSLYNIRMFQTNYNNMSFTNHGIQR